MNIGGQSWKFEEGQWITGKRLSLGNERNTTSATTSTVRVLIPLNCHTSLWVNDCQFLDGQYNINSISFCAVVSPESGGNSSGREVMRLKKKNVQLEEENNLLKLKIEILLDMVRT